MGAILAWIPLVALIGALAYNGWQIRTSNSVRTTELIHSLYDAFLEEKLALFYDRIRNGQTVDRTNPADVLLLNRSLTLFDKIESLKSQGVLKRNAVWEYFASEVRNFAANPSVWDYIAERVKTDKAKGFADSTIAFTGFVELYRAFPDTFKGERFPPIPGEHKALFDSLKWPNWSSRCLSFLLTGKVSD